MSVVVQVALDFVDLPRALEVAREAVAGGVDWVEAGTPLIKAEGLNAVRELKAAFPDKLIFADLKTMDAGRVEVEYAAKAGAGLVGVLGAASDSTIKECIEAAHNYGCQLIVDMIEVADPVTRAIQAEEWGADYVGIHTAIDQQMRGEAPFATLRAVAEAVSIPVSAAGGINSETAAAAVAAGAAIVVVGGAIIKATDATAAAAEIRRAVDERRQHRDHALQARRRGRHPRACSSRSRRPTSPMPGTASPACTASGRCCPARTCAARP